MITKVIGTSGCKKNRYTLVAITNHWLSLVINHMTKNGNQNIDQKTFAKTSDNHPYLVANSSLSINFNFLCL